MPRAVSWVTTLHVYLRGAEQSRFGAGWIVERSRRRYWAVNVVVFICLAVPTVAIGSTGWPVRVAAAAGIVGACVWEGVALRLRRFPLWADALETVAVALVALRYSTGTRGLVVVLAFALVALGFRAIYSTPVQSAVRTLTVLAAIYVGTIRTPMGLSRRVPILVLAAVLALAATELTRLVRLRASMMHGRQVAEQLSEDLARAKGRTDVHAAMLRAALDLLHGRADARVIIWDEPDSLRPTVAAGANADEVRTAGGEPLSTVPWIRDAIESGESTYRESFDVQETRSVLGFDPIPGAVFNVPLRHREQIRALSVAAREPIPPAVRDDIEYVAKVGEVALGRSSSLVTAWKGCASAVTTIRVPGWPTGSCCGNAWNRHSTGLTGC